MERNANYALVGGAALLLLIALCAFVVWLGRLQFDQDYDIYDVRFEGPVRGLSEGGEVHFNGIRVGEVTDIRLSPRNPNIVFTRVRLEGGTPIRTDSRAQLEPQGVTGVNYIQVSAGTPTQRLLKETVPEDEIPVIRSENSLFAGLLEGGGTVLARTVEALDNINALIGEQNRTKLESVLTDVNAVSSELAARRAIIADTQRTIVQLERTAAEFRQLAASGRGLVETQGPQTLGEMNETLNEFEATAEELTAAVKDTRALLARLEGPTAEFGTTVVPQISQAVASMQSAAQSIERLSNEVERSPRELLFKEPTQERELPQ